MLVASCRLAAANPRPSAGCPWQAYSSPSSGTLSEGALAMGAWFISTRMKRSRSRLRPPRRSRKAARVSSFSPIGSAEILCWETRARSRLIRRAALKVVTNESTWLSSSSSDSVPGDACKESSLRIASGGRSSRSVEELFNGLVPLIEEPLRPLFDHAFAVHLDRRKPRLEDAALAIEEVHDGAIRLQLTVLDREADRVEDVIAVALHDDL